MLEKTPLVDLLTTRRRWLKTLSGQSLRKWSTEKEMRHIIARKVMRDFDDQHPVRAAAGRYSQRELERWADQQAYRES